MISYYSVPATILCAALDWHFRDIPEMFFRGNVPEKTKKYVLLRRFFHIICENQNMCINFLNLKANEKKKMLDYFDPGQYKIYNYDFRKFKIDQFYLYVINY